jgi:transcriptional antiterminator NusG
VLAGWHGGRFSGRDGLCCRCLSELRELAEDSQVSTGPEQNEDRKPEEDGAMPLDSSKAESLDAEPGSAEAAAEEASQPVDGVADAGAPAEVDSSEGGGSDAGGSDADASQDAVDSAATDEAAEGAVSAGGDAGEGDAGEPGMQWYILKVQVNREDSIRDALLRRIKIAGLESDFGDIVVPTEDVAEFNKSGKRRVVKKKLYPGYIMANLVLNDDTWFLVRETPGIGDFTGSAGKPTPMDPQEVKRIIRKPADVDSDEPQVRTSIPFNVGDRVRVKEGYFENFEGDVEVIDEANGRVTVMINIFGRSTPVELEHWQIESV